MGIGFAWTLFKIRRPLLAGGLFSTRPIRAAAKPCSRKIGPWKWPMRAGAKPFPSEHRTRRRPRPSARYLPFPRGEWLGADLGQVQEAAENGRFSTIRGATTLHDRRIPRRNFSDDHESPHRGRLRQGLPPNRFRRLWLSSDRHKYDYRGGGHAKWLAEVHGIKLEEVPPARVQAWKRAFLAKAGSDALIRCR